MVAQLLKRVKPLHTSTRHLSKLYGILVIFKYLLIDCTQKDVGANNIVNTFEFPGQQ